MASAITAHTRAVVAVLLSVTICLPACSPATATDPCNADYETPATFDPVLAAQLQTALDANLAASGAPGASLTVHIPGQGTFAAGAGMRDILAGEPVLPRTRFRVGSITKAFAAAALLRLVERGELTLDDHPSELLPELGLDADITFAQLLSHTAGLFNYTDDRGFLALSRDPWEPEEIVAWSLTHEPVGAPGERYLYSNTDFYVVGLALEALSGQPFHEHVREQLLDPLELSDTSEEQHEGRDCGMSEGYVVTGAPATDDIDMSWTWAAGGLVSTGVDLCRWAEALYRGDVLSPTSRASLTAWTPQSIEASDPYGFATQQATRGGRSVVGHTGSTMGFKGELFIDLETGVCVAVLLNDFVSTPSAIAQPAWSAVFEHLGP